MAANPSDPPSLELDRPSGEPVGETGAGYLWFVIGATFGVYLAFITPIAISLALKVGQLAPAHQEYLGYITGTGALAALIATPLTGILSDRTRSRFGRRRPLLAAGTATGVAALVVMAEASTIFMLGVGWVLAEIGWMSVIVLLIASQSDKLPEAQRGRVSGLSGVAQQLAPICGVVMAGGLAGDNLLLFLVPGVAGALGVALFLVFVHEPDSRDLPRVGPAAGVRSLLHSYVFDPRRHPDFAWNWLGKFLIFFGITLYTTFTAFFLADRLHMTVQQVAGNVALLGTGGVVAAMAGALGGGLLSDRLHRRRIFVLIGAVMFASGVTLLALAQTVPLIFAAAVFGMFGLGLFSSVDQALTLDVLPERDTDAGRFMGIFQLATTLAQGVAPFLAPFVLTIGASGAEKNYTLLYVVAAAVTLAGGLTIFFRVTSVR